MDNYCEQAKGVEPQGLLTEPLLDSNVSTAGYH